MWSCIQISRVSSVLLQISFHLLAPHYVKMTTFRRRRHELSRTQGPPSVYLPHPQGCSHGRGRPLAWSHHQPETARCQGRHCSRFHGTSWCQLVHNASRNGPWREKYVSICVIWLNEQCHKWVILPWRNGRFFMATFCRPWCCRV